MLGNQSNGNKPVFRNARLFGPNCNVSSSPSGNNNTKSAATAANSINKSQNDHQSDFIDEDFDKSDVPEMKLLPMDYVGKVKPKPKPKCPPPPPPISKNTTKCKCAPSSTDVQKPSPKSALKVTINAPETAADKDSPKVSDKYLVYKQKHSIFGTSKDILNGKLKYVSDNDKSTVDAVIQDVHKAKEGKRKYLLFDSKKNNNSKFETIQYYFDNKSYEKYVDTKLYGRLNQISNPQPILKNNGISNKTVDLEEDSDEIDMCSDIDMRGFENSRSWEYRNNAKTESKLKLFETKQNKKQQISNPFRSNKSEGSSAHISGASSCSEVFLKRQNCRFKPQQKLTLSKSIGDLTEISSRSSKSCKTSNANHDVKRINQLFENAKQNQVTIAAALKSNIDNKEKYKVHKVVRDDSNMPGDKGNLLNAKKYHRSSTELNIKSPFAEKSCGFKNCKLPECPISHHNPTSSVLMVNNNNNDRRSKFDENFIKKFEDMMKNANSNFINNGCILRNNEITVNRTNISVNGKSNIIVNDTKNNNFSPPTSPTCHDVFIINSDCSTMNNENEMQSKTNNKTTIKINDSCFVVNDSSDNKLNNSQEKNLNVVDLNNVTAPSNWDKNIKVKNNPQPKFNNKIDVNNKIKNEENSVKIYVIGNDSGSSPTPSAVYSTISSTSPDPSSSSSSDSDKDDGYYDASSQGRSSSPEFSEMFKKLRDLCNSKQNKQHSTQHMNFGYDGTLFWNNSYFDDDETDFMLTARNHNNKNNNSVSNNSSINRKSEKTYACTKCLTTNEDLLSNYICICRNKVKFFCCCYC